MGSTGELWRCELCRHGPACGMHRTGDCGYAHSLAELLPPRERDREYLRVCRGCSRRVFRPAHEPGTAGPYHVLLQSHACPRETGMVFGHSMVLPTPGSAYASRAGVGLRLVAGRLHDYQHDEPDCYHNHHQVISIMSCIIIIMIFRMWTC